MKETFQALQSFDFGNIVEKVAVIVFFFLLFFKIHKTGHRMFSPGFSHTFHLCHYIAI